MKALAWIAGGVVVTLVALGVLGYVMDDGSIAAKAKAKKAKTEPQAAPEASVADPKATEDNVVPFAEPVTDTPAEAVTVAEAAATPTSDVATDALNPLNEASSKENQVRMKIAAQDDTTVSSIEQGYYLLVKAIHQGKIKGTIWRGSGELPDTDVVELRGRAIDLFTALRTPREYFNSERKGLTLAYQYATRKQPLIFLQLEGYVYVLGGDEQRFLSSVPHPDTLPCDPNGYLHVALDCVLEKFGLDQKTAQG